MTSEPVRRFASRHHAAIAALLSCLVILVGIRWSTRVAAGSDAYGYLSQAGLWLHGNLHVAQKLALEFPWPDAMWTLTPLGYRPGSTGTIVPTYPPGLPLLMAGARAVAGYCATFLVVPVCGGVLSFSTYFIGRRLERPLVGLGAALLVSSSPVVLFMLMAPMSDVPAAATWAVAVALMLGGSTRAVAGAGIAAAIAILIRPNLVPLVAIAALWSTWRDLSNGRGPRAASLRNLLFATIAGSGALAVGILNTRLFGDAFHTGYGNPTRLFGWGHVLPNTRQYAAWLVGAESPLAFVGLLALAIPLKHIWPTPRDRQAAVLFAGMTLVIWLVYLPYLEFDAWWYLRFLLPSWPMMAIGSATIISAISRRHGFRYRAFAITLLSVVVFHGVLIARGRNAFEQARGEWKYVEVAKVVETVTEPNAVILAEQHSGSLRYYAGRLTLRWDLMNPAWLDRAVTWFSERGHPVYLVLESWEVSLLRANYGSLNRVARLDWTPIVSLRNGDIKIFDAIHRDQTRQPFEIPESFGKLRCVAPVPDVRIP